MNSKSVNRMQNPLAQNCSFLTTAKDGDVLQNVAMKQFVEHENLKAKLTASKCSMIDHCAGGISKLLLFLNKHVLCMYVMYEKIAVPEQ
ncbi:hypothetical protein T4D_14022 [Trichinella pseudospiralis]|uniref:Uncharacterized protein n=1 Tax=Trichinella pseudospiralis TaxID=6337 RepID=A0A0V1FD29_TRIPS|nr:hypothetical protein T4D_14022 [Trichinella pseudospiralis]